MQMEEFIDDKAVMRLIKKGRKGIGRLLFSRAGIMTILLLLQVVLLVFVFVRFNDYIPYYIYISGAFSAVIVLFVINNSMDSTAKLTWMFLILLIPAFGALLYAYTQLEVGHRRLRRRVMKLTEDSMGLLDQDPEILDRMRTRSRGSASLAAYINKTGCFPVYADEGVEFYPMGEEMYREMLKKLRQAKKYIFMEFFIIEEGLMWGKILQILADKVREGVEVRVMYDGMCEFSTLTADYPQRMEKLGIACKMFSPMRPFVSTYYNYRDHRKILVIDGETAFTGGVNLADEYINYVERFGVWKDTGVKIQGKAVASFTLMFLQMWSVYSPDSPDYDSWKRYLDSPAAGGSGSGGFVLPYGDNPMDDYKIGEHVYMDMLNRSGSYVHIQTPYLILDGETETALKLAAYRGVDVSIILPGIPDKKIPYALAKGHYKDLLKAGVRIYEYTPGFVHAKICVSDDRKAVVGTINLDYRSLYHHFECAVYMHEAACIPAIEADFENTRSQCREITLENLKEGNRGYRLVGSLVRILAPLL